jgi:hypothetical protein
MKQEVSPKVVAAVVAAAVVLLIAVGWWVWRAPSVTAAPGSQMKDAQGNPIQSPRAGGGPTAEDLRRRDEYNAANPGAAGSSSAGRRPF